jgi:hypothetical protein
MNQDKVFYLQELLGSIDGQKLLEAVEKKAHNQPPEKSQSIGEIVKQIRAEKVTPRIVEFMSALSLVLLLANLSHPDAVFAKGGYVSSNAGINNWITKIIGASLIAGGAFWLIRALTKREE